MILGVQWSANLGNFSARFIVLKIIIYHPIQADNGKEQTVQY